MSLKNTGIWWRKIVIALVFTIAISIANIASNVPAAIAADNYNAATDTYQETRNPNRVNSTTEELAKSKINVPDKTEEKDSIYDRLVDKVSQQQSTYTQEQAKIEAKSK